MSRPTRRSRWQRFVGLKTADFDYELPRELIAQHPAERRDASRLLVYDRESGETAEGAAAFLERRAPRFRWPEG